MLNLNKIHFTEQKNELGLQSGKVTYPRPSYVLQYCVRWEKRHFARQKGEFYFLHALNNQREREK